MPGQPGREETHFGERIYNVYNGCNVGTTDRHDEG